MPLNQIAITEMAPLVVAPSFAYPQWVHTRYHGPALPPGSPLPIPLVTGVPATCLINGQVSTTTQTLPTS